MLDHNLQGCFDIPDERDLKAEDILGTAEAVDLPEEFTLDKFEVPEHNQALSDNISCTAQGTSRVHSLVNSIEHNKIVNMDPLILWEEMRRRGLTTPQGASLQSALKTIVDFGSTSIEGKHYNALGYVGVKKEVNEIKLRLLSGKPIFTGHATTSTSWNRMRDTGIYEYDGQTGGHAIEIHGWDKLGFIASNSYSPTWGIFKDGTFRIPYDQIQNLFSFYIIFDEKDVESDIAKELQFNKDIKRLQEIWSIANTMESTIGSSAKTLIQEIAHNGANEMRETLGVPTT